MLKGICSKLEEITLQEKVNKSAGKWREYYFDG
jgi:hypothetical protein